MEHAFRPTEKDSCDIFVKSNGQVESSVPVEITCDDSVRARAPAGISAAKEKVPSPLPRNDEIEPLSTVTLQLRVSPQTLVTARSVLPSPLKSAATNEFGEIPVLGED
jgi:hypothetical protein